MKNIWILPAFLAVAFLVFTIWTIAASGQPLGFVVEHTHSPWGAQIGIDLFNALCVGIYFGNVLSRQYRFRAWPYVLLTLCTGSPGVLALAARVLYARKASLATDSSGSLFCKTMGLFQHRHVSETAVARPTVSGQRRPVGREIR